MLTDDLTIKQLGVSFSLIIGGGIVVYLLTQQQKNTTRRQVLALKNEVLSLRSLLNESVKELTREIEVLRLSLKKDSNRDREGLYKHSSSTTLRSVESFTSACDVLQVEDRDTGDGLQQCTPTVNSKGEKSKSKKTKRKRRTSPVDSIRFECGTSHFRHRQVESPPISVNGGDHVGKYPLDKLLNRADDLHLGNDEDREESLRLMQDHETLYDEESGFLWRLARTHVSVYDLRVSHEERHLHASSAVDCAQRALMLCTDSSDIYKWLAISLGAITDFLPTKQKIETGWTLRDHIDRAIELNEKDAILRYIRGRWFYGVCQLTWIERKLAATLFAKPPSAKIEQALEEFQTAEKLAPKTNKSNQFYLAKCEYEMGDVDAALEWLEKALDLPCTNKDDRDTHRECEAMLVRLQPRRR